MKICILDISYFGEPFSGFARQPGQLTVQGSIEDALRTIFQQDVETTCAGRTDAGVHALHQYVSFVLPVDVDEPDKYAHKLKGSVEQLSHDDVHINDVRIVDGEFSARFDAKARSYSYFICNQDVPPLFARNTSWHIAKPLDIDAMREASKYLIGEHDFKSFCVAVSAKDKPTSRNVISFYILEHEIHGEHLVEIQIKANAFLHSMIRTIVGSLVKVGQGHREPEWIEQVIEAKDRQAAGECAPAKGLVFMNVEY